MKPLARSINCFVLNSHGHSHFIGGNQQAENKAGLIHVTRTRTQLLFTWIEGHTQRYLGASGEIQDCGILEISWVSNVQSMR